MPAPGDNPTDTAGDQLGRKRVAEHHANELRDLDASEGFVFAIVGPWGSGKTSLINMVRDELAREPALPIIDFNPWMFSGASQLLEFFFQELSAQLRLKGGKLLKIASDIDSYAELFAPIGALPFIGDLFDRASKAVKTVKERQEAQRGSVSVLRATLSQELKKIDRPIVVVIDDIDRLETSEIRDIFKLVRLTASFPNVIYMLAFDRERVELALNQTGFDGRAYLEKIIQLGVEIPAIPDLVLLNQLTSALDAAINDLDIPDHFDANAWHDALAEIIFPLIINMRDVRRYAAAVRSTARSIGGAVEMVDILSLEALRVFLPSSFDALVMARSAITGTSPHAFGSSSPDSASQAQVTAFLSTDPTHEPVLRAILARLFPGSQRLIGGSNYGSDWLDGLRKACRVAHPDVFALYLERVENSGYLAFSNAEAAVAAMATRDQFEAFMARHNGNEILDIVSSLTSFEKDFLTEGVVPGSIVLLNLMTAMPSNDTGMFSIGGNVMVSRVVIRLLRRLPTQADVRIAVDQILPEVSSLVAKLELVTVLGYGDTDELKLVSSSDADELARLFVSQLRAASSDKLAREQGLIRLIVAPKALLGDRPIEVSTQDRALARQVLICSRTAVRQQVLGNRAVHRTYRLSWDLLIELFGDENQVRIVVDDLRTSTGGDEELEQLVELADRYLSGWRPTEFGPE